MVGGSGIVGARAAKTLRRLQPNLPIAIAARDRSRAATVAAEVGGPTTTTAIDLERRDLGLPAGARYSAIIVLLKDTSVNTMTYALDHGIPYLSFSDFAFDIGPEIAQYIQRPTSAPILMLGHLLGGIATLTTLHLAKELGRVDTIEIAGVIDPEDVGGPASQADFERLANGGVGALIRKDGKFLWANGADASRRFIDVIGVERNGQALPVLDVASLAAATDAKTIRIDLAVREGGDKRGSTELVIELTGERLDGTMSRIRYEIVDDDVYGRLSAHGAALATERLLGLAGGPPVKPGLYHPEGLIDPAYVIERLRQFGARLRRV
ncbi:MAG: hypothetical protein HOW73_49800 [Polyangiaceae bacterium]|nr:hypothetical protein [Polyangiaceae bacterium]